jgi:exosortase/archaeosortase family protein
MNVQSTLNAATRLLNDSVATRHRRRLSLAALVAVCYLPTWLGILWDGILKGRSDSLLNLGFIVLGIQTLLQQSPILDELRAEEDDRMTGYLLLCISTLALIGFRGFSPSATLQALSVMGMLLGALWSTWGLGFFQRFPLVTTMFLASLYPHLSFITAQGFRVFMGPDLLERQMAIAGSWSLSLLGYQTHAERAIVHLDQGSVWVAPGCSGYDLAFTLCGIGFLLGQFMQARWKITAALMGLGILLAWIVNVPRIMVLAIASVYWGKDSFDFWHGPIGGQLFAGIVFTLHYYLGMWLIERQNQRSAIANPDQS